MISPASTPGAVQPIVPGAEPFDDGPRAGPDLVELDAHRVGKHAVLAGAFGPLLILLALALFSCPIRDWYLHSPPKDENGQATAAGAVN